MYGWKKSKVRLADVKTLHFGNLGERGDIIIPSTSPDALS